MNRIFVGYDSREADAYRVCEKSILRYSQQWITPLKEIGLRLAGLYDRPYHIDGSQRYDTRDGRPFSTEFSFTRFLVPALNQYEGWALFCDCDFMFRADVNELFKLKDDKYAVMCVKHDYTPTEGVKMDGQIQQPYLRKNWSSLVLWNCGHPANKKMTPRAVNMFPGSFLHAFKWLKDSDIGSLPESWNWLEGHSPKSWEPKAVHYTRGIPSMPGYEHCAYADEWRGLNGDNNERAA